jgi:hypothetical protein
MDNTFQKNPVEILYWNLKEIHAVFVKNIFYKYLAHEFRLGHNAALKRDVYDKVMAWVRWIVKDNRNFIVYIFGEQGDGKSRFAIWLAVIIQIAWQEAGKSSDFHWVFTENELTRLVEDSTFTNCHTAILDENPKLHGRGTVITEDALCNLVEQIRVTGKSIIVCSPTFKKEYPGMTVIFETAGKQPEETKTRAFVHFLPAGYPPKLSNSYVGSMVANVGGKIQEIYDNIYLPKKMANVEKTQKSGGTVTPIMNVDRVDTIVEELITFAKKAGWRGDRIGLMANYIPSFAAMKDKQGNPINLSRDEEAMLVGKVYDKNKTQTELEKRLRIARSVELAVIDKYDLAEEKIIRELHDEGSLGDRADDKLEAFMLWKNGWSFRKIGEKFGVSHQAIGNKEDKENKKEGGWIEVMNKQIAKRRGKKWEKIDYDQMDASGEYSELHKEIPGKSMPDNWGIRKADGFLVIHSDKCITVTEPGTTISSDEFAPEIEFALKKEREGFAVQVLVWYINPYNYNERHFEIDHHVPKPTYPLDAI